MKLHYIQHVAFETPGEITVWARNKGFEVAGSRLFDGDPLPEVDRYDWLVVMGGPMGVGDESTYGWLSGEKRAIAAAIEQGKTVIGVCLGAQLIASVLGARVQPSPHKEIGWFPVSRTADAVDHPLTSNLPETFPAFHWHGEMFDLPSGAVHVASSEGCPHQMFVHGDRVAGIQFHLEITDQGIVDLFDNCQDDINPGPFVQTRDQILGAKSRLHDAHAVLHSLLDRFPV
jgi:GMP synthase (glutamine-hydrolysing)